MIRQKRSKLDSELFGSNFTTFHSHLVIQHSKLLICLNNTLLDIYSHMQLKVMKCKVWWTSKKSNCKWRAASNVIEKEFRVRCRVLLTSCALAQCLTWHMTIITLVNRKKNMKTMNTSSIWKLWLALQSLPFYIFRGYFTKSISRASKIWVKRKKFWKI